LDTSIAANESASRRLVDDFDPRNLSDAEGRALARAERLLSRERDAWRAVVPSRPHAWEGTVVSAPWLLAHAQPAHDARDLDTWLERLVALDQIVELETAEVRAERGAARLPRPIVEAMLEVLEPLATGAPVDPLLEPFERAASRLPGERGVELIRRAREVVHDELRPAYARLVAALEDHRGLAGEVTGAWRSPETLAAFEAQLAAAAGPLPVAAQLHQLGVSEVARLHRALAAFEPSGGDVRGWFEVLRANPNLVPGSELGTRPAAELWALLRPVLPTLVARASATLPVEERATTWEGARGRWSSYLPESLDGLAPARPVIARTTDPTNAPWNREVSALRGGIPGRALFARIVTRSDLPRFLAYATEEAHVEGWSLWITLATLREVPGLERDAGFARLSAELVEAATLVADTGLHAERWSRAQTVDYLRDTTPLPLAAIEDLVLRIAAEPGRASAPFLGLTKLRALERRAEIALGAILDRPRFRRAVVDEGPLAPSELDDLVQRWIDSEKSTRANRR